MSKLKLRVNPCLQFREIVFLNPNHDQTSHMPEQYLIRGMKQDIKHEFFNLRTHLVM
ncbi:MAG: hypothetical protein ACOC35_15845 [Promethearchaeia archaeon]